MFFDGIPFLLHRIYKVYIKEKRGISELKQNLKIYASRGKSYGYKCILKINETLEKYISYLDVAFQKKNEKEKALYVELFTVLYASTHQPLKRNEKMQFYRMKETQLHNYT